MGPQLVNPFSFATLLLNADEKNFYEIVFITKNILNASNRGLAN